MDINTINLIGKLKTITKTTKKADIANVVDTKTKRNWVVQTGYNTRGGYTRRLVFTTRAPAVAYYDMFERGSKYKARMIDGNGGIVAREGQVIVNPFNKVA